MAEHAYVDMSQVRALARKLQTLDENGKTSPVLAKRLGAAARAAMAPMAKESSDNAPTIHIAKETKTSKRRSDAVAAFGGSLSRSQRGAKTVGVKPVVKAGGSVKAGFWLQAGSSASVYRSAAMAFEHGRGSSGTFRHPLFGDKRHWYPQTARPYMTPARDSHAEAFAERLADTLKTTIEGL